MGRKQAEDGSIYRHNNTSRICLEAASAGSDNSAEQD
jgi:hypothetical protein